MATKVLFFLAVAVSYVGASDLISSFVFPKHLSCYVDKIEKVPTTVFLPLLFASNPGLAVSTLDGPCIALPGGGLFFYWQAGVITYLRESGYDLSNVNLAGASAGALAATLVGTGVDMNTATSLALKMSDDAGVWERPGGLQGVWGSIIEEWLDTLLPDNAADLASVASVSLLITPVPSFRKSRISHFESKEDLINCNMASTHIPWFLDGKLTKDFRNSPHIDGSFLANPDNYFSVQDKVIKLDFNIDPIMKEKSTDLVKLVSKEGIWSIFNRGRSYGKIMDSRGDFKTLRK